jgi:SRSO17 transposase
MGLPRSGDAASRFLAYVEDLTTVIGHADRARPLRDYCVGLMMAVLKLIFDSAVY